MTDVDETHEKEEVAAAKVIRSLREDSTDLFVPETEESTATEKDKDESADTLKRIKDSPGTGVPKKMKPDPIRPSQVAAEATLMCNAVELCLVPEKTIVLEGEACNASRCTKCSSPFHHECLFVWQEECYCSNCFKQNVVTQCSTETLFKDLFQNNDWASSRATVPIHRTSELRKYTNNFMQQQFDYDMTIEQYETWKVKMEKQQKKHASKKAKCEMAKTAYAMKVKYEKAIRLAKQEWLLSTDGVVNGLRYDAVDKKFVAKLHYRGKEDVVKEETMAVSDDWVFDTYGIELANKLIDHAENNGFVRPVDEDGKLVILPMMTQTVTRVKYIPQKISTTENERGLKQKEVYAKAVWKGLQDDGTVCTLTEKTVTQAFGKDFVAQCMRLGDRKFVPIPVGTC